MRRQTHDRVCRAEQEPEEADGDGRCNVLRHEPVDKAERDAERRVDVERASLAEALGDWDEDESAERQAAYEVSGDARVDAPKKPLET